MGIRALFFKQQGTTLNNFDNRFVGIRVLFQTTWTTMNNINNTLGGASALP